ncbi:MAG: META domain-containing protein [Minisyncoccia bacterium]
MNKTTISIVLVIIFLIIGLMLLSGKMEPKGPVGITDTPSVKNITVKIGNDTFNLVNGKAEIAVAPNSSTKNILMLFGEPVMGDLDGDKDTDAAMLYANNPGGSGTFYYAVLAINNGGTYTATNAMLLGDRIAPQTVEIRDGRAVYNFTERKAGESFAVQPSLGKSVWVNYDVKSNQIGELVQNFEGEADPNRMTLGMKKWVWVKTLMNDGKVIIPKKPEAFTLTLENDGRFGATTDCNGVGGDYKVTGKNLVFTRMMSTLMACQDSQEQDFTQALGSVQSYMFTSKGELVFMLKADSGTMVFR